MKTRNILQITIAFVFLVLINSSVYTVSEWQQAIITKFGQIVGDPITKAGIHFKYPFINDVRYFDKRILNWDGEPSQVPTKDKKFILVDTTARWKIVDPVKFTQTVQNEMRAKRRITSILDGKTKNVISAYNLVETVRNTNNILEKSDEGDTLESMSGEIESIEVGRERLSNLIAEKAKPEIRSLGIELIDVLIRRIAYEKSVEAKVFDRMISERNRVAEELRSEGKGEEAKIQGKMNFELKKIQSEAYRKSQSIRGKAEAEAIGIYAKSVKAGPKFYSFYRAMEAYKKTLPDRAKIVLGTDHPFLKAMKTRM